MIAETVSAADPRRPHRFGLEAESDGLSGIQDDFCVTLMAMAGHDLRQPLQVITSAHDCLAASLASGRERNHLACAELATSRLATMLTQIVDALQLREFARDLRNEPVALGPVLDDLASEFSSRAQSKNICLTIPRTRAAVLSHPTLLGAILRNLLRNALDYTPAGGRVLVACNRRGPQLHIEVRDNGVGIPSSELRKIFDGFQRCETSRTDGLGLGLFIVQRAAKSLGHRVEVRSAIGHGSCFTLMATASRCGQRSLRIPRSFGSDKELAS